MNKAMPTAPSAPMLEDQNVVGLHGPPPPSYSQAMGHQPLYPPGPVQPGMPPYPPQNYMIPGSVPPHQQQMVAIPPQQAATSPQVTTTTVIVAGAVPVGPKPAKIRCPVCHSNIKTSTVTETQAGAHIACIVLFLVGCCICSCIPYCMDSCKSVRHTCPNCNSYLGTYKS